MSEIILYPTETLYALGVNPFDLMAWEALCELKVRTAEQSASWLVRSIEDINRYAEVSSLVEKLVATYLPGPVTIVLPALRTVPSFAQAKDGTVSFRISSDLAAQTVIAEYMEKYGVPMTCTSANVHGQEPQSEPGGILQQFGSKADQITKVIDDGPRTGISSTIIKIINDQIVVLREGSVSSAEILASLRQ